MVQRLRLPSGRGVAGRSFRGARRTGGKSASSLLKGKQEGVYKAKWGTETGRRPDADRIAEFEGGVPHEMLGGNDMGGRRDEREGRKWQQQTDAERREGGARQLESAQTEEKTREHRGVLGDSNVQA